MSKWKNLTNKQRKLLYVIVFVFMILFSCTTFPIYNFTHKISKTLTLINFIIPIAAFGEMGIIEAGLFPDRPVVKMTLLNLGLVLLGMGCRYLLEFGEVSNTYNFNMINSMVHIFATVTLSTLSWYNTIKKTGNWQMKKKIAIILILIFVIILALAGLMAMYMSKNTSMVGFLIMGS